MRSNNWFVSSVKNAVGDEYTFLEKYQGTDTKIKCIHNTCGYTWKVTPYHFLRNGTRCPKCSESYTSKQYEEHLYKKWGNQIIPLMPINDPDKKILVMCSDCGSLYYKSYNQMMRGKGCLKCSYIGRGLRRRKSQEQFVKEIKQIHGNQYKILGKYITNHTKLKFYCTNCKNTWETTPKIILKGSGCPYCIKSRGEVFIKGLLYSWGISYVFQKRFDDLKNPKTGYYLSFDFYIPEYKICIECDGGQHYSIVNFFGGAKAYNQRKYRDQLKNIYCLKHHMRLYRVNYTSDNFEIIKDYLAHVLGKEEYLID